MATEIEAIIDEEDQFVLKGVLRDTNIIQKSKPLAEICRSPLSFNELKILDVYLSRINSHDPQKRTVVFDKGELERLLGVSYIRKEILSKNLRTLMTSTVQLNEINENGEPCEDQFTLITLFSEAKCIRTKQGTWQVALTCSDSAMKYIFDIDHIGYLKYQLRTVTKMKSKYSYAMYMWLMSSRSFNKPSRTFTVPISTLRERLGCTDVFPQFKEFNRNVLKKSYEEIIGQTELRYTYKLVRQSKIVTSIEFTVYSEGVALPESTADGTYSDSNIDSAVTEEEPFSEAATLMAQFEAGAQRERDRVLPMLDAASNHEFTRAELEYFYELLINPDYCEEENIVDYFRRRYLELNVIGEKTDIKSKYKYLKTVLESERG